MMAQVDAWVAPQTQSQMPITTRYRRDLYSMLGLLLPENKQNEIQIDY